jgi:hypothetical protein
MVSSKCNIVINRIAIILFLLSGIKVSAQESEVAVGMKEEAQYFRIEVYGVLHY